MEKNQSVSVWKIFSPAKKAHSIGKMEKFVPFNDSVAYWKDPSNAELIKNAVPLESMLTPTKLIDFIRDHFKDVKNGDIVKIYCHYFPAVCLLKEEIIGDKSTHVISKVYDRETPAHLPANPEKSIRVLDPSEVQEHVKQKLQKQGSAEAVVLVEESTDKSKAEKDEGRAGKDKGGAGKDKSGAGRDEGGSERKIGFNFEYVSDLSKFEGVGKLFWVRNGTEIIYYTTAFYVGNRKIITAAHTFDFPKNDDEIFSKLEQGLRCYSRGGIFIPAMRDKEDLRRRQHHGYNRIENVRRLEQYQPRQHQGEVILQPKDYDICCAELLWNVQTRAEKKIFEVITPFDICHFNDKNSNWAIVGYGQQGKGRMICVTGYSCNETMETIKHEKRVVAAVFNKEPLMGMSGGPWLPMSDKGKITLKAKGVLSSSATGKHSYYAVSPCVTEETLKELGLR